MLVAGNVLTTIEDECASSRDTVTSGKHTDKLFTPPRSKCITKNKSMCICRRVSCTLISNSWKNLKEEIKIEIISENLGTTLKRFNLCVLAEVPALDSNEKSNTSKRSEIENVVVTHISSYLSHTLKIDTTKDSKEKLEREKSLLNMLHYKIIGFRYFENLAIMVEYKVLQKSSINTIGPKSLKN